MSAAKAYVCRLEPEWVTEPGMVWRAEWPTGKSSLGVTEWASEEFPTWDEAMSAALAGVAS